MAGLLWVVGGVLQSACPRLNSGLHCNGDHGASFFSRTAQGDQDGDGLDRSLPLLLELAAFGHRRRQGIKTYS